MADRVDWYFRQRVTEAELDLAFELLEKADRNLAADLNIHGIVAGAVPTSHSPIADLSLDLTAPARAYDNLGQRVFFGTGQTIDCAVDLVGIPTDVTTAGNERWLGVFLRFARQLSDPRTDGNSQQVMFRRDESFELVVRQAPEGPIGTATKVALQADELLVCDVLRRPGQTQIVASDIDTSRRQAFIFAQGTAIGIQTGLWNILQPTAGTVQAALDEVDAELTEHFNATGRRHAASEIDSTSRGFVSATNVQSAINELVDDLSSATTGSAGALRVGADAVVGTPQSLAAGNVAAQLSALLGLVNAHEGAVTNAHPASAVAGVAVSDSPHTLPAGTISQQLASLLSFINSSRTSFGVGHIDAGEEAGGHRTIHQPNMGGDEALLWDSLGNGLSEFRFRVYSMTDGIRFTVNALWTGAAWMRDNNMAPAAGFRLAGNAFEVFCSPPGTGTFTGFAKHWTLPLGSVTNSAFELDGSVQETGRVALAWNNASSSSETITACAAATFRNRFPAPPASITFATDYSSGSSVVPSIVSATRDGFGYVRSELAEPGDHWYWVGTYVATV